MKKWIMIIIALVLSFLIGYLAKPYLLKDNEPGSGAVQETATTATKYGNVIIFPEPTDIIELQIDTLGNPLPKEKDDGSIPVELQLTAGGALLNAYGEIKIQGSSTAKWPKKNWSVQFFADEERTQKLALKIGDSIASDKWIAKAEWVDPTMLRNGLSYRLWETMVLSRAAFPQYEVEHALVNEFNIPQGVNTGAQGFPKSHPAFVMIDGEHYGISMWIIGHDPKNFNIDKDNPNHIYMAFDARGGYTPKKIWDKFSEEGIGEWIEGYSPKDKDFTEDQRKAIGALGELINGSQANFEEHFAEHLDKTNIIDMMLFMEVIYDFDGRGQDIEIVTYDLNKWFFLPWDKDTTFGMNWDESGILEGRESRLVFNYEEELATEKPWFKTYRAFKPEVEARYAQLRNIGVFSVSGLHKLVRDITDKIPRAMWDAEVNRWKDDGRPSLDETSPWQILDWFGKRLEMLDAHFNYQQ